MRVLWGAWVALAVLTGCATQYRQDSWSGGFSEVQLDRDLFRITFAGNAYTRPEQAADYALLRGAEVTLANGFAYYTVVEDRSRTETSSFVTPVETTTKSKRKGSGEVIETSTTTGGHEIVDTFPTAVHTIRCFQKRPDSATGIVYDARFVCGSLGKKYKVPSCGQQVAAK